MDSRLLYTAMSVDDIGPLADVLLHPDVYQHLGGRPDRSLFCDRQRRALAGPPDHLRDEVWVNYTVRLAESGQVVGRLEATVHHQLAEIAYLYGPQFWGNGYATEGVVWLHEKLREFTQIESLWATTTPANTRSAGLLRRCGYLRHDDILSLPKLYSYDPGDLVFRRSTASHQV